MLSIFGDYNFNDLTCFGLSVADVVAEYHPLATVRFYSNSESKLGVDPYWDKQLRSLSSSVARKRRFSTCLWLGDNQPLLQEVLRQGLRVRHILAPRWHAITRDGAESINRYDTVLCYSLEMFRALSNYVPVTKLIVVPPGYNNRLRARNVTLKDESRLITVLLGNNDRQYNMQALRMLAELAGSLPETQKFVLFKYGSWSREQRNTVRDCLPSKLRVVQNPDYFLRRRQQCQSRLFIDLTAKSTTPYFAQEALALATPVVTWDWSLSRSVVVPGRDGILVSAPIKRRQLSSEFAAPLSSDFKSMATAVRDFLAAPARHYNEARSGENLDINRQSFQSYWSGEVVTAHTTN